MRNHFCVVVFVSVTACSDDGTLGPAAGVGTDTDVATGAASEETLGDDGESPATAGGNAGSSAAGGEAESSVGSTGAGASMASGGSAGEDADGALTGEASSMDTAGSAGDPSDESGSDGDTIVLPTANASFDYQLGGAYDPPQDVTILSRDRTASPAPGLYNLCYVNGFQTQPNEESWWLEEHPDLLLRDENGDVVIDPDWDEILLDVRTDTSRAGLLAIVGGWIEQCALDGFDAVEIDNLDTYSRSGGLIEPDHAVAYMSLLSAVAHDAGVAIAQKNSAELLDRRDELGTDFAVAEECNEWDECQDFRDAYGDLVFVIEYDRGAFEQGCAEFPELSIVLRDLDLVTPADGSYVYDGC